MDILLFVVLFVGVATAGVTQVVAGTGVRLILPPLAVLVVGHEEGLRIALTLGLVMSLVMFLAERKDVLFRPFVTLGLPIAVTAPLWVFLVDFIPQPIAARLAGVVAILAVVVSARQLRTGRLVGLRPAILTGAGASALFALGGAGGPELGAYARDNRWPEREARATVNACIALAQVMVLGFMGFPTAIEPGFPVALGGLAVGLLLGAVAVRQLPKLTSVKIGRGVALALAGLAAMVLLFAGTLATT
ncbi:MAG: hypothetical protein Q4G46_03515 [Propionibacteriaceae bacterium]|nr:hypothetical protein [Propionibacteriaceae bacterium]